MSSINYEELFNRYYQNEYDFNTTSLSKESLDEIRQLVREKRVDYALAPMGTKVFSWIQEQSKDIRYEMVSFNSEKIDGMLYVPTVGKKYAYIVLNSNKPLINQIFTAAHEYYHYIKDYQRVKEKGHLCDRRRLDDVNEKCACRFAAELLLPREALDKDVSLCLGDSKKNAKNVTFDQWGALIITLTVLYEIPLKAAIYRLVEEGYITDPRKYIRNLDFIKKVITFIRLQQPRVDELYATENKYVTPCRSVYSDMKDAFLTGNATREDILTDAQKLGLDIELINDFLEHKEDSEDDEDDEELFQEIGTEWGRARS